MPLRKPYLSYCCVKSVHCCCCCCFIIFYFSLQRGDERQLDGSEYVVTLSLSLICIWCAVCNDSLTTWWKSGKTACWFRMGNYRLSCCSLFILVLDNAAVGNSSVSMRRACTRVCVSLIRNICSKL